MKNRLAVITVIGLLLLSPTALRASHRTAVLSRGGTSEQGSPSFDLLVKTVIAHADKVLPEDELIEFNGIWVKQSNYSGVALGDRTHYYCLAPHVCSCPVCRGVLDPTAADQLYSDESTDFPLTIYAASYDRHDGLVPWTKPHPTP